MVKLLSCYSLKIKLETILLIFVFAAVTGDLNIFVALPVIIFLGCEVAPHHVAEHLQWSGIPFLIANIHELSEFLPVAVVAVQSQVLQIDALGDQFRS